MYFWQKIFLLASSFFSFSGFLKGLYQCKNKKNPFGLTSIYNIIGAFVWGDTVVFGLFWTIIPLTALLLNDWLLFLLIISLFWLFRSIGEMIYWFSQQFSGKVRNPPENLRLFSLFSGDSVWFAHQIIYQCLAVISTVLSIYFAKLWLMSRF